ncbi:MAG: methylated-DNA--[protein]-cysteine S-methyltransferase [Mariprofundus sp.]
MIYPFDSPLGPISYAWDGVVCRHVWLEKSGCSESGHDDPVSLWLAAYFDAVGFDGTAVELPPLIEPATLFQAKMRAALPAIPAGEVRTYGELAKMLGTSPRAMGQALGANPLPILIPCHRVIAVAGLGGFSCGLDWKKKLLRFEQAPYPDSS